MAEKKKKSTKKKTGKKKTAFEIHVDVPDDAWKKKWWTVKRWHGPAVIRTGVSFGSALAMVISYARNESILWAILHGLLSWLYVIYFVIFYRILG